MLILKCTEKAAREFGSRRSKLPQLSGEDDPTLLGAWFVHAVQFGRRKALIFMNADTLFSFLVPYRKEDLKDLQRLFLGSMLRHFLAEGLPPMAIERVMDDYRPGVVLARTDDRRVIGVMNDAVANFRVVIQMQGGDLLAVDLLEITRAINRTPQWKHGGEAPVDMLRTRLAVV